MLTQLLTVCVKSVTHHCLDMTLTLMFGEKIGKQEMLTQTYLGLVTNIY